LRKPQKSQPHLRKGYRIPCDSHNLFELVLKIQNWITVYLQTVKLHNNELLTYQFYIF